MLDKVKTFSLRPYQLDVVKHFKKKGKGILKASTSAGKTRMMLSTITVIGFSRALIVCTKSSQYNWYKEIQKLNLGVDILVIDGMTPNQREKAYKITTSNIDIVLPQIVIIRYGTLLRDVALLKRKSSQFDIIVFDEMQKLRNHASKTFRACYRVSNTAWIKHKFLCTATDQSRGPQDLWTALHILAAHVFTSYWKFVNEYMVIDKTIYGNVPQGVKKSKLGQLQRLLKHYIKVIPESVTDKYLPKVRRHKLHYTIDQITKKYYDQLMEHMLIQLPNDEILTCSSTLAQQVRAQQLLTCPKLIHPDLPYGNALKQLVNNIKKSEKYPHVVIFTLYKKAFPFINEYLRANGIEDVIEISGSVKPSELYETLSLFEQRKVEQKFSVLLCTYGFSEGFDLPSPKNCYGLGFSWDNNMNEQAEGRLRRGDIEMKPFVDSFYLIAKETVDTRKLDVLDSKKRTTNATYKENF